MGNALSLRRSALADVMLTAKRQQHDHLISERLGVPNEFIRLVVRWIRDDAAVPLGSQSRRNSESSSTQSPSHGCSDLSNIDVGQAEQFLNQIALSGAGFNTVPVICSKDSAALVMCGGVRNNWNRRFRASSSWSRFVPLGTPFFSARPGRMPRPLYPPLWRSRRMQDLSRCP